MIPFKDNIPTRTWPVITVAIIVANCAVFFFQIALPKQAYVDSIYLFGAVPSRLTDLSAWLAPGVHNAAVPVFTSMFMHAGWLHLAGNMLYLWIFGNNVEDSMGHLRFVFFYLLCGMAAVAAQTFSVPDSTVPMVGASGAISGVLGAYLILHPFARVQTLIFIFFFIRVIELPAIFVLLVWFLIQVTNGLTAPPDAVGVAWYAHIGGFVVGLLFIRFFQKRWPVRRAAY